MICKIKFVSCLIMGILQKIALILGFFSHTPCYPVLLPSPVGKFDPYPKTCPWPSHKRKVQSVKKYKMFLANVFRCSVCSNVAKYSKSSPVMSSFQYNPYIESITQKNQNVQSWNLCHWNCHFQKPICMEYQGISTFLPGQNRVYVFHSISFLKTIFVP